MIKREQIDKIDKTWKALKVETIKFHKLSEKRANMDYRTHTQRAIENADASLNWSAMNLDKLEHYFHLSVVNAGLANHFPYSHYGEVTHRPSAWQEYKFMKELPDKLKKERNEP